MATATCTGIGFAGVVDAVVVAIEHAIAISVTIRHPTSAFSWYSFGWVVRACIVAVLHPIAITVSSQWARVFTV